MKSEKVFASRGFEVLPSGTSVSWRRGAAAARSMSALGLVSREDLWGAIRLKIRRDNA